MAAFALVLSVVSAVPVLAAQNPSPPGEGAISSPSDGLDMSKLPSAAAITSAIERAEREEAERKEWLRGPEATLQREQSQTAYADLGASASEALLESAFPSQLEQLNDDPSRILSAGRILASAEEMTATVRTEGEDKVLESNLPVKTEDETGKTRKVDVGLEATSDGFETDNALVDVAIPKAADQPIEVGDNGVAVKLGGAVDRVSRAYTDEDVFTPDILQDTDMLVSPVSTGVEIFNILRSEDSPEKFHYQVDVPAGAELVTDGEWGAEVVRGDESLAVIPQPIAVDAQGTDVPVEVAVEGNSLVLSVDHRDGKYAMPILLDPSILENDENWIYGENHNALDQGVWQYTNAGSWWFYGSTYCIYECFGPGGAGTRGLYVSLEGQRYYGANQYGQWIYSAPPWSYISMVRLGPPYVQAEHNCPGSQYPQPHNYFGLWSVQTNNWNYISVNSANQPGTTYTLPFRGDSAVFGLSTGGGIPWIPCWRDLYAGGAAVWLDDDYQPSAVKVQDPPTTWIRPETPVHIVSQASDTGLGIQRVVISSDGAPPIYDNTANQCSGTWRSRCLTGYTANFDVHGASFREGRRVASVVAFDATGKSSNAYWFETKMDGLAPEVKLEGQLARVTHEDQGAVAGAEDAETLRLPVYNLRVDAKDQGADGQEIHWQSGVRDVEVRLDGVKQAVPWVPTASCAHDCPRSVVYPLALSAVQSAGKHTLSVVVTDFAGNARTRNIEFEYFPATGMKDEYVMQYFPLADGVHEEGEPGHSKGPELAVNVMNGNLVYHETDVEVQGAAELPLEVERFYNSMLPNSENSEWGDGWTLAQTPELKPGGAGGPAPAQAEILDRSGDIEGGVTLPTQAGASKFDPDLQATVTKTADGGYELKDETGETPGTVAFDATGQAEALVGEGHASVEYDYENGEISELSVNDPATFVAAPSELQIPEAQLITEPTYASSFGSNGSGDGQLKAPAGAAVDGQGYLWVVDKSNNRVEKFDATGKYVMKFGSLGSGDGQFSRPTAIAIASNGDLLVTDAGNGRVERFNSSGVFLSKFGSKGTGNGQFNGSGPEGIAIDTAGNIWVSDTYGGRLEKFSSAGAFLQAVGTKGAGTGQLGEPTGLDIAPNGDVWVADWQNNRISVFNSAGTFVTSYGSSGTGDGQFRNPDAVKIDKLGNVWVGDQTNSRVVLLDLSGQFKGKFGSSGSGQGQFSFSYPMGLTTDSRGHLWVADVNNNRVQQWTVPIERPAYMSAFGAPGTTDGQFSSPADVTEGADGSLWVVDRGNNRIEKFDGTGKFQAKFGALGTGDGQFNRPTAVAVDRDGNLLVVDAGNNRVDKFDSEGRFVSKFGAAGAGNGQFSTPEGIAADFEGNIWVADSGNGRVERFDEDGTFTGSIGTKGSGTGQLGRPMGLDVGPEGNLWVADMQNNRVAVFEPDGDLVRQFGSLGTAPGQFNHPSVVEIDPHGNVWVADDVNQRIERFDLSGNYVGQFGGSGSAEGQFAMPTANNPVGIAATKAGAIWVTDQNHYKVQRWQLGNYRVAASKPIDLKDGDPQVEVDTNGGLVSEVSGTEAGTHTYIHSGDDLTSHVGPAGETRYAYDASGRMTKVILANGTYGSIAYHPDGRVKSVTVDPAGASPAKTREFVYEDEPNRRTIVIFPDAPHITYDIGEDGSVFKWWSAAEPPVIEMTGNLTDLSYRETSAPIPAGAYVLTAHAWDPEGIASINVIVSGAQLVDEWSCPVQHPPGCVEPIPVNEWVMETGNYPPGPLPIEVIATDQTGEASAKRFWVNIPPPPPPSIGAPVPPKFSDIKRFRAEYGLEINFPVANEIELDERIFNLIGAWNNPNSPAGEVARASWETWGVPLRPEDIAELEYRERFVEEDGPMIEAWAEGHHSDTYAGYQLDDAAGGLLRIGFTQNQEQLVSELIEQIHPPAADRLTTYPYTPTRPLIHLEDLEADVVSLLQGNTAVASKVAGVQIPETGNSVVVETTDVPAVQGALQESLGSLDGISVISVEGLPELLYSREHVGGRILAGDRMFNDWTPNDAPFISESTAGFGARETRYVLPEKRSFVVPFMVTAGHTGNVGTKMYRVEKGGGDKGGAYVRNQGEELGEVARDALTQGNKTVDALALRLRSESLVPNTIVGGGPVRAPATARKHQVVCMSGSTSNKVKCGRVVGFLHGEVNEYAGSNIGWIVVKSSEAILEGDSGGPVWAKSGHASIGLASANKNHDRHIWLIQPLLTTEFGRGRRVVGALNAYEMGAGSLVLVGN